jgi:hypothetical protein
MGLRARIRARARVKVIGLLSVTFLIILVFFYSSILLNILFLIDCVYTISIGLFYDRYFVYVSTGDLFLFSDGSPDPILTFNPNS